MKVVSYPDVAAFWRDARGFLERDEIGNTQLLAIAGRHAVDPGKSPPVGYLVVDGAQPGGDGAQSSGDAAQTGGGATVAAALRMPNGTLFLSPATPFVLRALHDALVAEGCAIGDVVADRDTVQAFADATGVPHRAHVRLQLYRLDDVLPIALAPGAMRQATDADFDLLCAWQTAFVRDANVREGAADVPERVASFLRSGGAWLWDCDGLPVCYAAFRNTPIASARIAPVYTPETHRGRGYASSLVAAMSRHVLASGRRPVYLYADMANPTANGIYRRVGFRAVAEHLHLTRVCIESAGANHGAGGNHGA